MPDSEKLSTDLSLDAEEVARIRALWDEGKASGAALTLDLAQARCEARERLSKVKASK